MTLVWARVLQVSRAGPELSSLARPAQSSVAWQATELRPRARKCPFLRRLIGHGHPGWPSVVPATTENQG